MITYIIVDDEPIAHRIIERYGNDIPHLELKGKFYNALQAMQFLSTEAVDLMFLDINMPKLKGFEFLKTLSHPPKVIVTTAYKEFALESYELNVCDYLLKPFSFERFVTAVNKVVPTISRNNTAISSEDKQRYLFLKGDKKYHRIHIDDILFVEALGNYTKIMLIDETVITHLKISSYEELLSSDFLRVHKSFIVAIDKINVIEGNRIHIKEHNIPIGTTYKKSVTELLNNYGDH
ncbi:LytR/AlgR family response regulator transcription factor [Aquimarina sp. 2201CG14-23]|uniref:LytR/AlgR family response regulator transcription factor n=1 Tax=Aquimarina mycalae TaxID=3040073 RepID=UPI002477CEE3|nr:LytTR family DNA-binding domain-containing protein [Aquimarina sp. 2201CG14-23]MDH7446120.1 LytTR family DNA-binding domain-containing protein [Aquimarina sp. 2201CG14-23]